MHLDDGHHIALDSCFLLLALVDESYGSAHLSNVGSAGALDLSQAPTHPSMNRQLSET